MPTRRRRTGAATNGNGAGAAHREDAPNLLRTRRSSRAEAARASSSGRPPKGRLILIGGGEDREDDMVILREVASRAKGGRLAVVTAASAEPDEMWKLYRRVFLDLGVKDVVHVAVDRRDDAYDEARIKLLDAAQVIFFTGGDQVRITAQLGGAPMCDTLRKVYERGGTLAGTSAGTSCMSETMLVAGGGEQSHKVKDGLQMAPGLGFVTNVIIDQHFAERGRIGRLLGAVAQNPRILGVGIDEDTAILLEDGRFRVFGGGAVYVIDAISESYTNVSERDAEKAMSIFDVRLHIMSEGDCFDLATRRPSRAEAGAPRLESDPGAESKAEATA
jgi:cyanophycinase